MNSPDSTPAAKEQTEEKSSSSLHCGQSFTNVDIPLLFYFVLFYVGNYGFSVTNKLALKAAAACGGAAAGGFPLTISAVQLGIGCCYGFCSLWWGAPPVVVANNNAHHRRRKRPAVTARDLLRMLPVAACQAGSHSAAVFGYAHGSVSFVQIVKAAEPAFAAILSQFVYYRQHEPALSRAKWLCLPIIIGGVILSSIGEVNFSWAALASACASNVIAAFRGNENKRLFRTEGLKDRIGGAGNQFALTAILGFLLWTPAALLYEGRKVPEFVGLIRGAAADAATATGEENELLKYLILSALFFYWYNELRTVTLKKTTAVTGSVANTLKRVIVIVGAALALGEPLGPIKLQGSMIAIGGAFLYSAVE